MKQNQDRFTRGWKKLKEVDGQAGIDVIQQLKEFAPDLARFTVEYPFGDVYSRNVISNQAREMVVVAALAALGHATPQLKVHLNAALNVGISPEELSEIMIIMSVYAGFPAALNGTIALQEVLVARKNMP